MKLNWCLKGINETSEFRDADAERVVTQSGILSAHLINGPPATPVEMFSRAQASLSEIALDDHVHDYGSVRNQTPYISLSAGCYEHQGFRSPPLRHRALVTAANFATNYGRSPGYIFQCWVVTSLRPCSSIPGLAEEIRDLQTNPAFFTYHFEGELAAKLYIPYRQIVSVTKVDARGHPVSALWAGGTSTLQNPDFVSPYHLCNLQGLT